MQVSQTPLPHGGARSMRSCVVAACSRHTLRTEPAQPSHPWLRASVPPTPTTVAAAKIDHVGEAARESLDHLHIGVDPSEQCDTPGLAAAVPIDHVQPPAASPRVIADGVGALLQLTKQVVLD